MLKITIKRRENEKTLILEGKLVGAWVSEVDSFWKNESSDSQKVQVDLAGVTFIDAEGKALLGRLHREGAALVGKGCLTQAIIAQISGKTCSPTTAGKSSNHIPGVIKPILIAILFLLFAGSHRAQAQHEPTIKLTLHETVTLALEQNPRP